MTTLIHTFRNSCPVSCLFYFAESCRNQIVWLGWLMPHSTHLLTFPPKFTYSGRMCRCAPFFIFIWDHLRIWGDFHFFNIIFVSRLSSFLRSSSFAKLNRDKAELGNIWHPADANSLLVLCWPNDWASVSCWTMQICPAKNLSVTFGFDNTNTAAPIIWIEFFMCVCWLVCLLVGFDTTFKKFKICNNTFQAELYSCLQV